MKHDLDDLATNHDLALLFGVGPSAISNWKRRDPTFPQPLVTLGNTALWSKKEVLNWYLERPEVQRVIGVVDAQRGGS